MSNMTKTLKNIKESSRINRHCELGEITNKLWEEGKGWNGKEMKVLKHASAQNKKIVDSLK